MDSIVTGFPSIFYDTCKIKRKNTQQLRNIGNQRDSRRSVMMAFVLKRLRYGKR